MFGLDLIGAVESGDRLQALKALRGVLAEAIDRAEPREIAPLARQLQIVLADIDSMAKPGEVSFLDRYRREDRKPASAS